MDNYQQKRIQSQHRHSISQYPSPPAHKSTKRNRNRRKSRKHAGYLPLYHPLPTLPVSPPKSVHPFPHVRALPSPPPPPCPTGNSPGRWLGGCPAGISPMCCCCCCDSDGGGEPANCCGKCGGGCPYCCRPGYPPPGCPYPGCGGAGCPYSHACPPGAGYPFAFTGLV